MRKMRKNPKGRKFENPRSVKNEKKHENAKIWKSEKCEKWKQKTKRENVKIRKVRKMRKLENAKFWQSESVKMRNIPKIWKDRKYGKSEKGAENLINRSWEHKKKRKCDSQKRRKWGQSRNDIPIGNWLGGWDPGLISLIKRGPLQHGFFQNFSVKNNLRLFLT